jgi:hypothetical protein
MARAPEIERRQSERRSGADRREVARTDPLPQRARLRRQSDVLAHLDSLWHGRAAKDEGVPCLDTVALRF